MSNNNFEELRKRMIGNKLPAAGLVDMLKAVQATDKNLEDFERVKTGCPLPDQILTLEFMRKNLLTWSNKTFGQRRDPLTKLEDELRELKENPRDISEYADVLTLLLDAFSMHFPEVSALELLRAAHDKLEINKARKWAPVPDKPGTWQHIK